MQNVYPSSIAVLVTLLGLLLPQTTTAASPLNFGSGITVQMRGTNLKITHATIVIGDVANVTGGTPQQRQKIEALDLDDFENGVTRTSVSSDQVKFRMVLAGIQDSLFSITGPANAIVEQTSTSTEEIQLRFETELSLQLATQFGIHPAFVTVKLMQQSIDEISKSNLELDSCQITGDFGTEIPIGNTQLDAMLIDGDGGSLKTQLKIATAVVRDLVIAKRNISKGELMDAANIQMVRRPVMDRNVRFASYNQVVGKTASADIQQFAIVRSQSVRTAKQIDQPDVQRNKLMNAYHRRGNLVVQLSNVRTVTDGNIGEAIEIINPISGKRILAVVMDANTVEIR